MATFRSGNGGTIAIGGTTLHVKTWSGKIGIRDVENTHSGTSGSSNYEKVVIDASFTAEGPWDEDNQPDTDAGFMPGNKITATLKVGAGAKTVVLTNCLVVDLELIVDNTSDIVRYRLMGKGGEITRTTT